MTERNYRIYLAGKITNAEWRYELVDGLREVVAEAFALSSYDQKWPILEKAVLGTFDYVGPYFCPVSQVKRTHQSWGDDGKYHNAYMNRDLVSEMCLRAIERADLVFAWVDRSGLYGTAVELGYARALNKPVFIGCPASDFCYEGPEYYEPRYWHSMWFPLSLGPTEIATSPVAALRNLLAFSHYLCESPVERAFWDASRKTEWLYGMQCQFPIGRYRADFCIPDKRLVIEIDGHDYHSSKEQRGRDAKRDRTLVADGWRVVRFTGSEVHANADHCVSQVVEIVRTDVKRETNQMVARMAAKATTSEAAATVEEWDAL